MCSKWLLASLFIPLTIVTAQQAPDVRSPQEQFQEQPEAKPDPFNIKTSVTVTATRDESQVFESPVSVGVVSRREMDIRRTRTVDNVLSLMEGVYVQRSKGDADNLTRINLRGFNGASRSLVMLDGQPLNDSYTGEVNWTSLPMPEIDRVEVARGPFSSLYGGNALGGVINILTRPVSRRELEFSGQYGTYQSTDYSVRYADRFLNRLGISIGYRRLQNGGYPSRFAQVSAAVPTGTAPFVTGVVPTLTPQGTATYRIGENGVNWYNQHSYRIKGEYTLSDRTVFWLQYIRQCYGYGYDEYETYLRDSAGAPVDNGTYFFDDRGTTRRLSITPGSYLQGPGEGVSDFTSMSVQHRLARNQFLRLDAGYFDQPDVNYRTPASAATLEGGAGTYVGRHSRAIHGNLQYLWSPNSRHHLTFGTETRHDFTNNLEFSLRNWTDRFTKTAQTYFAQGKSINQGVYVQDHIRLGERLQIVAGGRYDYWRTYSAQTTTFPATGGATNLPERANNTLSGKVAALYTLPGDWALRASTGTSFRNPNVYELYRITRISNTLYYGNPNLETERLFSFEAGVRKRIGERFNFDAAAYQNNITNMVYRVTDLNDPTGLTRHYVNAGEGRTRGFEFAGGVRLASWLQFRGTYTYTQAIITRNPGNEQTVGKRVPHVPEHMTSGALLGFYKKWTGSLTGRYSGGVSSNDINNDLTKGVQGAFDPFFTADATISYDVNRRLQVFAQIENLADRRFYLFYLNPGRLVYGGLRIRVF
jgi:Outer membrane cobalamin receptor protein